MPSRPGSASTMLARQSIRRGRTYRLVQLRLREGAATPTEIADAQASLTRAQQNYLNARYNYLIAMDRLEYAMGVGQTPMSAGLRTSLVENEAASMRSSP